MLQVIEVPVDNVEAVLSGFGESVLDCLPLIIDAMNNVVQPRFVLLNEIYLLFHAVVVTGVGVLDIFIGRRCSPHEVGLGVLAYASRA